MYQKTESCIWKCKPLNIAEVLTMWKVGILWIHTNSTLQVASYIRCNFTLKDIVVAFVTYNLKRTDVEYTLLTILIGTDAYKLKTYSI